MSNYVPRFCPSAMIRLAGIFAILAAFAGCDEDTAIRKYTVAKKDIQRRAAPAVSQSAGVEQTILGLIVPRDNSAWFLKLMDAPEKVEKYETDFRKIVDGLSFDDRGEPKFNLAEGWIERPERQIVYSRLLNEQAGITATVTQLPAPTETADGWRDSVYENINRWRKQVSLQPVAWESMESELKEIPSLNQGPAKAYYVSMTGKKSDSGMAAPFMQSMGMAPSASEREPSPDGPSESATEEAVDPQPSANPLTAPAPEAVAQQKLLKYEVPSGWTEEQAGGIRLVSITIPSDAEPSTVTVSTASGEPDMFIDMWFGQLGVESTAEMKQDVLTKAESLVVNGKDATLYTIRGADNKEILVCRIPWKENEALYAKFTGTSEQVARHGDEYRKFVQSLTW